MGQVVVLTCFQPASSTRPQLLHQPGKFNTAQLMELRLFHTLPARIS
jgi:hypothetical protein